MSKVLDKILLRVKAVAPVAVDHVVSGSGSLVESLMRWITGDGPDTSIEMVARKIDADSALMALLLVQTMKHETRMIELNGRLSGINRVINEFQINQSGKGTS